MAMTIRDSVASCTSPRNWSVGAMVDTDGDVTALLSVDIAKLEFFTGDAASLRKGLVSLFKGL